MTQRPFLSISSCLMILIINTSFVLWKDSNSVFNSVTVHPCDENRDAHCLPFPRMLSWEQKGAFRHIRIEATENCSLMDFQEVLGYAYVDKDSIVLGVKQRLTRINSDGQKEHRKWIPHAACDCILMLDFVVEVDAAVDWKVYYESEHYQSRYWRGKSLNHREESYSVIKSDTINRIDHHGFLQGIHKGPNLVAWPRNRTQIEKDWKFFVNGQAVAFAYHDSLGRVCDQSPMKWANCAP